jgi:hypothetical protein
MSPGQSVPTDATSRIRHAVEDLEHRTLSSIDTLIGRLVYVASTRDYNTGTYYHDGLTLRFDHASAQAALETCHRTLFESVLGLKLAELVDELERYLHSTGAEWSETMRSWQRFRAYQMLIPAGCDAVSTELFLSNMKVALATLHMRQIKSRSGAENPPSET